jgi:hypothetical protein
MKLTDEQKQMMSVRLREEHGVHFVIPEPDDDGRALLDYDHVLAFAVSEAEREASIGFALSAEKDRQQERAEAAERKLDLVQQLLQALVDEDTLCRKEDKFLSIGAWRSAVRLVLQRIK